MSQSSFSFANKPCLPSQLPCILSAQGLVPRPGFLQPQPPSCRLLPITAPFCPDLCLASWTLFPHQVFTGDVHSTLNQNIALLANIVGKYKPSTIFNPNTRQQWYQHTLLALSLLTLGKISISADYCMLMLKSFSAQPSEQLQATAVG